MGPRELINQIEASGGVLTLNGESINYKIPVDIKPLIAKLSETKTEAVRILRERQRDERALACPTLPQGVRLIRYEPKVAPVTIGVCSTVIDAALFIRTTLEQLRIALEEPKRRIGWSVFQLIERLGQMGVIVMVDSGSRKGLSNV